MLGTKLYPYTHKELSNHTHKGLAEVTHKNLKGYPLLKEWTSKDYYNYWELNRIEMLTEKLRDYISVLANVELEPVVTNRNMKSIEFKDSLNRIERNIEKLGIALKYPKGFIEPKTYWWYNMPFSYEDANRLETNLRAIYEYAKANRNAIPYCGMYICGEEVV